MLIHAIANQEYERYREQVESLLPDFIKKSRMRCEKPNGQEVYEAFTDPMNRVWLFFDPDSPDRVVGFFVLEFYDDRIHVAYMYMLPEFRRFRKKAFWILKEHALSSGVRKITALSHKDFGCRKLSSRYSGYMHPGFELDAHLFAWSF